MKKEKYVICKNYVEDLGSGIDCNSSSVIIAEFDTIEKAIECFKGYINDNCKVMYDCDNHPKHKEFVELSTARYIYNEEIEEWEFDELYYGFYGLKEYFQEF